jgi:ribosomal protein L37AE/L43A
LAVDHRERRRKCAEDYHRGPVERTDDGLWGCLACYGTIGRTGR